MAQLQNVVKNGIEANLPKRGGKARPPTKFLAAGGWVEVVRQFGTEAGIARMGRKTMTTDRKPRHPDLIGADAALERAARRALELALRTGTPCWVMRDGKMIDIAAEVAPPQRLIAAEPRPR